MKTIYTINNFAKQLVMVLAVSLTAVNTWGADPQASFSFTASTAATALSVTAPASTSSGTSIDGHSITSSPITISFSAGTGGDPYFWQTSTSGTYQVRMYNGNSITISAASGYTIKAITATGSGTGGSTYWNADDGVLNGSVSNASLTTKTFRCIKTRVEINTITVTYVSSCSNSVTISKGTETNCTFTLSTSGSQPSCSGVSTTVTVSPNTGYTSPSVTQSGASAAPTITGSSNTYTVAYGANTTGTSTINVSCSAKTYTVTLNDNGGSGGSGSKTVTYNANTNMTSAVAKPTRTHYDFGGYWTSSDAGTTLTTQIIDENGAWKKSVTGYTDATPNWIRDGGVTLYAKWTEHSLTNYRTLCCTELGTINGSVSFTNPTEAVVSWDNIANVSSWTVKYKIHGAGSWSTTNVSASAPYTKVSSNDSRKCTITGLTCNTAYDFLIIANPADTYCDKEEELTNKNSGKWDLDYTFSGAALKDGDLDEGTGVLCGDLDITIEPLSVAYELPSDVTVTIGGDTKTKGTEYTWNSSTGALFIDEDYIDGDVAVSCTASLVGCLEDPSIGAVSLKTGGTFNLGQVDVTVATSGTGSATCAWIDYGFVWSESANPTVGGSGCTKVAVGSDGSATTWNGSLTKTSFATGTTYYYRAYGKNSKDGAAFVYSSSDGTFTPRSVTFDSKGGSAVATSYVNSGSAVSEPSAPTKTGYTFSKWQLNGEDYDFESAVTGNITLDAVWTANEYSVTFDKNGGQNYGDAGVTATYGAAMPSYTSNPRREGYTFTGYFDDPDDGEGKQYYNADKSSANNWDKATDATLYAHWQANHYTITLNNEGADDGKGGTESISVTYDSNENLTSAIDKPVKTGNLFCGYYTAASGSGVKVIDEDGNVVASASGGGSTYTSATKQWKKAGGDVTLYAYWKEVHTVTWYVDGEEWSSGVVTGNTSVVDGEKVSALPTAPTKANCDDAKVFMGWRATAIDGVSAANPGSIFTNVAGSPTIDANKDFYAVFADEAGGDFTRVTNVATQIEAGKKVIMGYEAVANSGEIIPIQSSALNGTLLYTGTTEGSAGYDTLTISSMSAGDEAIYAFTIRAGYNSGYWAFEMSGDNAGKYLSHRGATSGRNSITSAESITSDGMTDFSIVVGTNDVATITNKWGNENTSKDGSNNYNYKILSYNYNSGSNPRAAIYRTTQTGDFVMYLCNPLTYSNYVTSCASCDADATFTNTTPAVSEIGCTSATLTMEDGLATLGAEGCNISDYGFVIGTSDNPAIGGSGVTKYQVGTSNPTIGDDFSYEATDLTKGTRYYIRAYAINKHGTAYSTSTNFWTKNVSSIAITTTPTKTNYIVGETFDATGMVVTATMASGATEDVTSDVTYSSSALTSGTNQNFAINYTLCETEESVNQKINVYTLSVSEGTNADKGAYSASANIITISSLTTHYTAEFSVTNGSVSSNGDGTYTVTPDGKGNVSVTINYREAAQVKVYYKANGITLTSLTQDVYESETTTLPTGSAVSTAMTSQSVPYPETGYTNFWGWSETDFDATTSEPTLVTGTPTITTSKTYYAVFTNVNVRIIDTDNVITSTLYPGSEQTATVGSIDFKYHFILNGNISGTHFLQFKSDKNDYGRLYNNTAMGNLIKLEAGYYNSTSDIPVYACSAAGTITGSAISAESHADSDPYVYTFPSNTSYFMIKGDNTTTYRPKWLKIYYASGTVKYMTYKNYTISLDNEGGSGSSSTTARYKGTLSDVTPPTKAGYSFDGYWNGDNGTGTQLIDEDGKWIASVSTYTDGDTKWIKNTDADLYAKWAPVALTYIGYDWNTASDWDPACVPTIEHDVIIPKACFLQVADAKAKSVTIHNYGDEETEGKLYIYAGGPSSYGGLVVAEGIKAVHSKGGTPEPTTDRDLSIHTDFNGNAGLICGEASSNTQATYEFYSKVYRYGSYYINQYVGIPFASMDPYDWYSLTIFEYDTEKDKWKTPVLDEDGKLKPFTAYNIISKVSGSYMNWYYLYGTLNLPGTSGTKALECGSRIAQEKSPEAENYNAEHPFFDNGGDYMFANSWTAPISIKDMTASDISDLDGDEESDMVQCIYIFNAGYVPKGDDTKVLGELSGTWSAFPFGSSTYMAGAVIPAGQAFLVTSKVANATLTLDYGKHVYNPALASGLNTSPLRAPRRNVSTEDPNVLRIKVVRDSIVAEQLYLLEREDFTFGYDDGWDGNKIMGLTSSPQLYAQTGTEKMAVSAVPDITGLELGFKAGTDTNVYVLSFEYNDSEPLYLYDRETQIFTRINNEASYSFTTDDTDEHARFVITRSNAPMIETGTETLKGEENRAEKFFDNNMLFIRRGEKVYNVDGSVVK